MAGVLASEANDRNKISAALVTGAIRPSISGKRPWMALVSCSSPGRPGDLHARQFPVGR